MLITACFAIVLYRIRRYLRWKSSNLGSESTTQQDVPPPPGFSETARAVLRLVRLARPKPVATLDLSSNFAEGLGRSKTRPCRYFAKGCCQWGEDCYFSHTKDAIRLLRVIPDKKEICSFHALGIGCFNDGGYCKNAHGVDELLNHVPPVAPPCFPPEGLAYSDAHCHLDAILFVRKLGYHWTFKTKFCKDADATGRQCPFPKSCQMAHGAHDLRPRPPLHREELVELAKYFPPGFAGVVHNCCDEVSIKQTLDLVQWGRELLDGKIYASFGVHPTDYYAYTDELEALMLEAHELCGDQAVAWGECGLDHYQESTAEERAQMRRVFVRQVKLAVERGFPLVVHSRDAENDVLEVLREHLPRDRRVHLHSFGGTVECLDAFLEEWPLCFLGVNGVATYHTAAGIVELVSHVPLEQLLLETDGPFMMPEPYRYCGLGSHAGHVPWIAVCVAAVKDVTPESVLAHVAANFASMYGRGQKKT